LSPSRSVILIDPVHISAQGLMRSIQEHSMFSLKEYLSAMNQSVVPESADLFILHISNQTAPLDPVYIKANLLLKSIVIIPSGFKSTVMQYWDAGTASILTETCSKKDLEQAMENVAYGKRYYCQESLAIISNLSSHSSNLLSQREIEVIRHLALGKTTLQIADHLHISAHTVNSHRKNIMKKLNFKSPVELVVYAVKYQIID